MSKYKKIKYAIDNQQDHDEKAQPIDTDPESIEKKTNEFIQMHGRLPLNRREFLGAGLIQFAGFMALPPMLKSMGPGRNAKADVVCDVAKSSELPALITLNLQGGAGLSANWMPLDQGLQPLASYSKMGWGVGPAAVKEFANQAPFFATSPLLAALKTAVPDTMALLNTNFVGVAVRSQDDSGGNRFDITGLTKAAGLTGTLLANLGTSNTVTGNNTQPAFVTPPAPLVVGSYNDIQGALSVSGSLTKIATRAPALFSTIQKLNTLQAQKYAAQNYGQQLEQLMVCRSQDNTNLVSNPNGAATDPLSEAPVATAWGITANTSKSSRDYVFATMVYNALKGNAGSANLTIGGYDYHNGTRTTGDTKDAEAGTVIGRIITTAYRLNKKVFIIVTSDGSVTSAESDVAGSPWGSDGGLRGSSFMIAMDPTGGTTAKGFQLGHYSSAQAADDKTLVGTAPERAAAAMFANYLAFGKQLNLFEKTLPRIFNVAELDTILML
jgi:hypothetical protein